jgi:hypothetical protein
MQLLHLKQTSGAIFFKALALLLSFLPPVVFIHGSILQTDKRKKNDNEPKKKKKRKIKTKAEQTTEDSDPTTARTISARENNTTAARNSSVWWRRRWNTTGAANRGSRKQGDKERIILQASSDIAPSNGRRVTVLGLVLMLKSLPIAQFMNKKHNFVVSLSKGFPLPSIGFLFPVHRSDTLSTPLKPFLFLSSSALEASSSLSSRVRARRFASECSSSHMWSFAAIVVMIRKRTLLFFAILSSFFSLFFPFFLSSGVLFRSQMF